MRKYTVTDGHTIYTRISKQEARKRYDAGDDSLCACPCKLRPGAPFGPEVRLWKEHDRTFDQLLNEFNYYKTSYEAGYYAAFYIAEEEK